jgi:hypothetical protein
VSRIIVHKVGLDEEFQSETMSEALLETKQLTEETEIIHSREDEELHLVSSLVNAVDALDEGEALVIYKVII